MDVQITTQDPRTLTTDVLIVGVARQKGDKPAPIVLGKTAQAVNELLNGLITERNAAGEFKGNAGELLSLHPMGKLATPRVLVVGLGELQKLDTFTLRRASASAARHVQQTGAHSITLALDVESVRYTAIQGAQVQVEGALLGLYTFRIYQHNQRDQSGVTAINLLAEESQKTGLSEAISKAQILADATNFARTLVNQPPNVLTPRELANQASGMAKEVGLEYEIFEKARIRELKMGGLLAVSQGSAQEPYFIILRYQGAPERKETLALVGKGITFDTGGISLKPADHMDEMKGDMGGAAAVIGAMQAIGRLKPQINVTALIPTCENMPSGTSYRPGDILRMFNGKTIEIVNTDAEGRLILADALAYASQQGLSPIIDLATLTGGIVIALGETTTGLFCNDEELTEELLAAAHVSGEKHWPMPLDDEYSEQIRSDVADIKQTGGRPASAITAAKILENFVGDAKWAHLDIAGTSYFDSKKPYQEKGGTGVGVRTLAELALQLAQK